MCDVKNFRPLYKTMVSSTMAASLAACGGNGDSHMPGAANKSQPVTRAVASVAAVSASVAGLNKISETRVGRTVCDYVLR